MGIKGKAYTPHLKRTHLGGCLGEREGSNTINGARKGKGKGAQEGGWVGLGLGK